MKRSVKASEIKGLLKVPSSKSMTQRAIAGAILSMGQTTVYNPSDCDDAQAAIAIAKAMGAEVRRDSDALILHGNKHSIKEKTLNCGESGLGVRMFSPIAAQFAEEILVTGEGSLLRRPINMIEDALSQLGVRCKTNNGYLPMSIRGPIQGGYVEIDGSVSSQLLTGLLMTLPCAASDSSIHVKNLKSKAYIDMTLELLNQFGIVVKSTDYCDFSIQGNQRYTPCQYTVEGDWSAGAMLLVAGAIAGEIHLKGLREDSRQSDIAILKALESAGANVTIEESVFHVSTSALTSFSFDASESPDLFPPLVALAAYCRGVSEIRGTQRLVYKESNRALALQSEFQKMGIRIDLEDDVMKIHGGKIHSAIIDSHNDHRIAMAAAISALGSSGEITIFGSDCVAKSYPDFFSDLKSIGGFVYE